MTTTIAVNGLSEEEFRRAIERKLRHGKAAEAREQLRGLLAPYSGPAGILPARFLSVTAADLTLTGWDSLGLAIARHDEPYRRITALSIAFGWEGEDVPQPDEEGRLKPHLETSYFTDDAFPFSQSSRADLLEGYSYHGCTWAGDCEATDTALGLDGIDDLRGALALLEARLLASEHPDEEEIRAGSLGACLLSVLLYEAVEAMIASAGLPRRLCVMAGCNDVYPYFDAPVAGVPDEVSPDQAVVDAGIPAPRYSSLLMTGVPRGRKRAVLVLEETAAEAANRIALLRGHPPTDAEPASPPAEPEPSHDLAPEGTIVPIAGGPLMTKKPHGPGWDFRDMLGPRPSALERDEGPKPPPNPSTDGLLPQPSDHGAAPSSALPEADGSAETLPGFALLDSDIQARLHELLATSVIEPGFNEPGELVETPASDRDAAHREPSIEPQPPEPQEQAAELQRPGLLARLRAWWTR